VSAIALGARVRYHHRAAVARLLSPEHTYNQGRRWRLYEGVGKRETGPEVFTAGGLADEFYDWPHRKVNKTIMVWPSEGVGIVIGLVKRGIGKSSPGYQHSGAGGFEPDYEPGYFASQSWHELYAIRHELRGIEYVLVPKWAVIPE
jgi:hypothetical protein